MARQLKMPMLVRFSAALSTLAFALAALAQPGSQPVAVARYVEFDRVNAAEALVEAVRQSSLAAQVAGRITTLAVKAGDAVKMGQLLVQIDARTATQAEAASQSQVREAQANLANAKMKYERNQRLAEQRFISQAALDQARAEFLAAQAQTDTTLANAGQATTSRNLTTIVAPYDGIVAATEVEVGDMATPGRPLVTVFDPRALRVTATVPQALLAQTRLDAPMRIEIPALKRSVVASRFTVVPMADSRTHTTRVRLDLAETAGLMPGQYARVWLSSGRARALAIPEGSVVRRSEVTAVYVLDAGGRARLRQVRLGESAGDGLVEVLAGISAGERVALEPVRAGIEASSGNDARS